MLRWGLRLDHKNRDPSQPFLKWEPLSENVSCQWNDCSNRCKMIRFTEPPSKTLTEYPNFFGPESLLCCSVRQESTQGNLHQMFTRLHSPEQTFTLGGEQDCSLERPAVSLGFSNQGPDCFVISRRNALWWQAGKPQMENLKSDACGDVVWERCDVDNLPLHHIRYTDHCPCHDDVITQKSGRPEVRKLVPTLHNYRVLNG